MNPEYEVIISHLYSVRFSTECPFNNSKTWAEVLKETKNSALMISSNPISVLFPAHVYSHSLHPEELVFHAAQAKHSPMSDMAFWWLNRQKYPPAKVSRTIICMSSGKSSGFVFSEVHVAQVGVKLYVLSNPQAPIGALQLSSISWLSWWSEKDGCNNELNTAHTFSVLFRYQLWPMDPRFNWLMMWSMKPSPAFLMCCVIMMCRRVSSTPTSKQTLL